jgi:N-acetyl-alpha-D-muramate 1-phosphate uridylyltransferase
MTALRTAPKSAMLLAAGFGKRMLPLTQACPKPLLRAGHQTMLDEALDRLAAAEVTRVVVNASHLGEQIVARCALRQTPPIILSIEAEPLENGGGVVQALPFFDESAIFIVNADLVLEETTPTALETLRAAWDPARMDILLLVNEQERCFGFEAKDYVLHPDGRLQRLNISGHDHHYCGHAIVKTELYRQKSLPRIFSNLMLFDQCETALRLYGTVFNGRCHHLGTPQELDRYNTRFAKHG